MPHQCQSSILRPSRRVNRPFALSCRLLLPRLFRIAAHNLNLLRRDVVLIVQLEIDVFDEERPNLVTEAVRIQMTLLC